MKANEHSAKEIPTVELEEIVRTGRCPDTYAIILAQAELDRRGEGKAEEGEGMKASEITKNELVKVSQNYPDPYVRKMAMELLDRRGEKAVEPDVNFYNGIEWFACWLIDHAEGETITEEQMRPWAIEAWNKHIAKPASEGKACKNCGNGPKHSKKCEAKECTPVNDRTNRFSFANWTPNPTPPAKPDALDREIATEEYMNDEGKPEPVEPLPFLNDRTDDLPIVIRRMNLFLNVVNELQRKHDALEAEVKALREKMEGGK